MYIAEFVTDMATHTLAGTVPKERQTENKDQAASDKWNYHFFKMKGMGMAKKTKKEETRGVIQSKDTQSYMILSLIFCPVYFPVNQTNKD